MPHAPLLAPEVARSRSEPSLERVRAAMREAARAFDRTVVIVSPHGASTGVYIRQRADLRTFGVPRAEARVDVPERAARELSAAWGRPVLDEPPDHGVTVPVLVGGIDAPVIGVALAEGETVEDEVTTLVDALRSTDHDVVASVNTGAGITARAPMMTIEGGEDLEAALRTAIERDASAVADPATRLASHGASCCLGPLLVLAKLCEGSPGKVLAHEWPYGVGYVVATFGGDG